MLVLEAKSLSKVSEGESPSLTKTPPASTSPPPVRAAYFPPLIAFTSPKPYASSSLPAPVSPPLTKTPLASPSPPPVRAAYFPPLIAFTPPKPSTSSSLPAPASNSEVIDEEQKVKAGLGASVLAASVALCGVHLTWELSVAVAIAANVLSTRHDPVGETLAAAGMLVAKSVEAIGEGVFKSQRGSRIVLREEADKNIGDQAKKMEPELVATASQPPAPPAVYFPPLISFTPPATSTSSSLPAPA
eukprot:CAMPEP_0171984158 /NCGR_PEP_ID=MMETSP0993-20121228/273681_1 /TAXON_ID=483369 /ORGANISM="non described non described, Strain CCMP2098" /LENGTH=244 /DNA_ID=CAMNT_0012636963 /DNA_START=346 /DNA_END=1076 /DNA_ORIENTATION=+